jgi:8-oxo-dGTP diphosphatase
VSVRTDRDPGNVHESHRSQNRGKRRKSEASKSADQGTYVSSFLFLLVRRKRVPFKGLHALPGGFVRIGETVEQGCRRELMEETGSAAGELRLVGVYSDPKREPARPYLLDFLLDARYGCRAVARRRCRAADWIKDWSGLDLAFDRATILADAERRLRLSPDLA